MHVYYVFGLLLIFLLSVSYSLPTTENPDNYWKKFDDGEDDYDDYYSEEQQLTHNNHTTKTNSSLLNDKIQIMQSEETTSVNIIQKSDLEKITSSITKCPDECDCDEELLFVNCSNRNLHLIPKMLPISLIQLDLSNNLIANINKTDIDYLVNLKYLLLNDNEINNLNENIFINNKNIHTVNLANNQLKDINPNSFSQIPSLSILNFSSNAIKIPKDGSFLNAPELETLVLSNCSINEIYDDTFRNTSGLIKLMLDKNDFNMKINTRAFNASMQNLVKLTLPELEQSYILELCQILQSIDNISFKNFDLSCFEIVAGLSFRDSVSGTKIPIFNENSINQTKDHITNTYNSSIYSAKPAKSSTTRRPKKKMNGENATIEITHESDENEIQIPAEVINYCLFTIMGLAVIGLIIGIICRKDVYGIKTKLCRTKKARGPAKTDQIKPTEEIPLNKV